MAPPLVTLLSAEPEIQYVALRNINLIVQRRPTILAHEIKVFFCKYNDPIYVKMEKLEIMIKLASDRNIDQVLLEFKEYATEVDVDFVRKVVRAIGRCAIKLERAAERCISVLLELIKIKVNYVVQEVIIVIKDIFRRYPNTYESIIATLCKSLDTLDEPEAKASMIWIIGEYAERIDNADELLESFLESFPEEPALVQLQFLTATVKLFLKKPTEGPQQMIQVVLNNATMETDNPDLRDLVFSFPFSRFTSSLSFPSFGINNARWRLFCHFFLAGCFFAPLYFSGCDSWRLCWGPGFPKRVPPSFFEASPPRRVYVSSGGRILAAQSEDPETGNLL
ncbi:hypothetical protein KIW84_057663 [Lathyrus oleraceus]|uniref:Clathrin/coatomer adaptor adaptin-like N-terminal domain-containing protein n=1 Tax=Pisum sativum TaxID=3888 RepID=A0A9D5ALC2_PEA|nr:hypothetical protein KIW84_057663 [Pisum sativum]